MAISGLVQQQTEFPSAFAKEGAELLSEVRSGERNTPLPSTHVERGSAYLISYF